MSIKTFLPLLLILGAVLVGLPAVHAQDAPHILILSSYHHGYRWSDTEIQGLIDTLPAEVVLDIEHMDTKRFNQPAYLEQYEAVFIAKFAGQSFDAIVTLDDNAFDFMLEYHPKLFPHTPVIFGGVNNLEPGELADYDLFTGIVERIDYRGTIETALAVYPVAKRVLVVTDATTSSQENRAHIEQLVADGHIPVEVVFLDQGEGLELAELMTRLADASSRSVVYYSDFFQDKHGRFIHYQDVLPQLAEISNAPIFVHNDFYLGYGATGGTVVNGYYHGKAVSHLVQRVLKGEKPSQISIEPGPLVDMFDYEQLARWGISTNTLPANNLIINQPERSFYQRYHNTIWAVGLFTFFQTSLIAYLMINIAHRRRAARTLQQSEERYRSIVEASPLPIAIHANSRYMFVNQAAIETLGGHNMDDFVGKPVQDIIHPDFWEEAHQRIQQIYTQQSYAPLTEQKFRRLDGTAIDVLVTATMVDFEGRSASQVVFSDITSRKEAERDRFELAVERERVNMLRCFIADASHDLKTPLATINTATYLLENKLANLSAHEKRHLQIIEDQTARLTRMVDDMLHMSRLDAVQQFDFGPVDLNALIQDIVTNRRDRVRHEQLVLDFIATQVPCLVEADELMLSRAIVNLIENAIHYTPAGGRITIRTFAGPDVSGCEVCDTGIGIAPDDLPHIFERFFRSDRARQSNHGGSGLGLAIAHKIIDLHGGTIEAKSKLNQGTVFRLNIPTRPASS